MIDRYGRAAGLDAFARCPTPGCTVRVYAPFMVPSRCRLHGGQPDLPQVREADPFGIPTTASATDPSPVAPRLPSEAV